MYLKVPEGDKRVTGEPVLEKIDPLRERQYGLAEQNSRMAGQY